MDHPLRNPEEILAYKSLSQLVRSGGPWTVGPAQNVLAAAKLMAEKNIGFLLVVEKGKIVGVLSERDCVRRVLLAGKSPETTPISEVMTRNVITAEPSRTFAECMKLMHTHGIRHLPILENGAPIGVISVRDILRETVAHHEKIISDLERERMTMVTSTA